MMPAPDAAAQVQRETRFRWGLMAAVGVVTVGWLLQGVLDAPQQPDNYTNGFSHSPGGHSALVQLLKQNGRQVRVGADGLQLPAFDDQEGHTLLLLEPRPEFVSEHEEELRTLFRAAQSRPCSLVLVFPKRYYEPEQPEDGQEVITEHEYGRHEIEQLLEVAGLDGFLDVDRQAGPLPCAQAMGDGFAPQGARFEIPAPAQWFVWKRAPELLDHARPPSVLARAEDGRPVAIRVFPRHESNLGGIVLVADPDVVSNRWLGAEGAGRLALHLLSATPPEGELHIEETLHGFSTDAEIEYLAMTPPGLWLTLSVLLLLLLFGWREATLIRPVAAEAQDRRARLYAVDGMARMMLRARDHGAACRALMRRAGLVLGRDSRSVRAEGVSGADTAQLRRDTGRIRHVAGADDLQRLVNAAAVVAERMRRETAPSQPEGREPQGQT